MVFPEMCMEQSCPFLNTSIKVLLTKIIRTFHTVVCFYNLLSNFFKS